MKVKRAAPGGEGLVIDHFDKKAVANYLRYIERAFERTHTPYPHTFFNDSYEVSDATWTPTLLEEFEKRRGYKLEEHFPELLGAHTNTAGGAQPGHTSTGLSPATRLMVRLPTSSTAMLLSTSLRLKVSD